MDGDGKRAMPKWHAAPADLVRVFGEMVQPLPGVAVRKMFGYPSAFFQGQMFAGLHQESMILRLSEEDRARFLTIEGASQFEPMAGRPMREYVVIPPAMIGQTSDVTAWLDRALAYAASLPAKEPKKTRKSAR
jgi:TfoX/Sxy family transcriptional regulator of competence genes